MQPLANWLRSIGRSPEAGRHWEKSGRIKVERFYNRKYAHKSEIERFFREGSGTEVGAGQFFATWLKSKGVSRMTGYRWVRDGKISVSKVSGLNFVSSKEIERFEKERV